VSFLAFVPDKPVRNYIRCSTEQSRIRQKIWWHCRSYSLIHTSVIQSFRCCCSHSGGRGVPSERQYARGAVAPGSDSGWTGGWCTVARTTTPRLTNWPAASGIRPQRYTAARWHLERASNYLISMEQRFNIWETSTTHQLSIFDYYAQACIAKISPSHK